MRQYNDWEEIDKDTNGLVTSLTYMVLFLNDQVYNYTVSLMEVIRNSEHYRHNAKRTANAIEREINAYNTNIFRIAKANKEAADKLAAMEQERQTDSEKIADLANRLDEKERAEKRAKLVAKVAKEKGVPADLIAGDDEESMAAWADRLKEAMTPPRLAKVSKPGTFDRGGGGDGDPMRGVVRQLFGNE